MTEREQVKSMIESSICFEDADIIIDSFTPCHTVEEKLAYLYGMFDVGVISHQGENKGIDYELILTAIIDKKWRV